MVGSALMARLREAVTHHKIMGIEPIGEAGLDFEVGGNEEFVDQEGFAIDSKITIFIEGNDTEKMRYFVLAVPRLREGVDGEPEARMDYYKLGILKNSEQVAELSRATINEDFVSRLDDLKKERARATFEECNPVGSVDNTVELMRRLGGIGVEQVELFEEELDEQMSYGQCNQAETLEVLRILQKARHVYLTGGSSPLGFGFLL